MELSDPDYYTINIRESLPVFWDAEYKDITLVLVGSVGSGLVELIIISLAFEIVLDSL